MNPQYGAALEKARAAGSELVKTQGEPQPSWLDRFLGLVPTDEEQEQISQLDSNSSDIFRETAESGDAYAQASQNQPVTGEGSQGNRERRAAIAAAAAAHEGDTSMPYTPDHAT